MDFLLCLIAACVFLLARNQAAYSVRGRFIYADDFPASYNKLPGYDAMVIHPRYWLLWTTAHWHAWLARQTEAAQ